MRAFLAGTLVLLATLLVPVVIGATWLLDHVGDTDAYVQTVAPLAEDPELRSSLGEELGVAATAAVEESLPVPLPSMATDLIADATARLVAADGFPELWREAHRDVHEEFLRLMESGEDADADGWVFVDLSPLLTMALDDVEIPGAPASSLGEVGLRVPLVPEADLLEHRERYLLAEDVAALGPWVLAGVLLVAIAVAPGLRGRLRTLGFGGLGVGLGALAMMVASGPISEIAADRAEQGRSGLTRLITEVTLESLAPYARTWLLVSLAVGSVALAASWWPRSAHLSRPRG